MQIFAAALFIGAVSAIAEMEVKYINHLAKFGKNVADKEEFNTRLVYFGVLDEYITEHNAEGHNYTLGHNQFSDWSRTEYTSILGYKHQPELYHNVTIFDESANDMPVNWVEAGAVTPVKD